MRPDELMIGNWVFYEDRWFTALCKVVNIEQRRGAGENDYSFSVHEPKSNTLIFCKHLKPIPLTAEILEKNGFALINEKEKMYRLNLTEDESVAITADFKADEPFVHARNTCYQVTPHCLFVHQLQNALKIVGIYKDVIKEI